MLPARYRLRLRRTLPFYTYEHKAHFPGFSLYWHFEKEDSPEKTLSSAQAVVVVPKKTARTAVRRNRLKRVLYRELMGLLPTLPSGLQLVVFVRKEELEKNLEEVTKKIRERLR
ncbi:ribonuclease P protein component [Patescibacteria group bacterium]|nr:ribonuclease P protein component [Patescibacteria group bacterium]